MRPPHHLPDGRFRNPWPEAAHDDAIRRRFREVAWEWFRKPMPPDPGPESLPTVPSTIAHPRAEAGQVRVTWVGHATHLIQLPGLNLLTDPMWSARPSPVESMGRSRFVPASPGIEALPPIDAVLVSHDHYDHLDRPTVARLTKRFGRALRWYTPLGYREWFASVGVSQVTELDWWDAHEVAPGYRLVAAPARHWTRRTPWGTNTRLWCSWAVLADDASAPRVYWGGDSGYAPHFREIGTRLGPFSVSILPIGAYDPRWFMSASHMDPEEAVAAYEDLGRAGAFLPSHWGTFRLTFEDPLEPPRRLRTAWSARGLDERLLHVPRHGETVSLAAPAPADRVSQLEATDAPGGLHPGAPLTTLRPRPEKED
ncbi:MAG: MBL fold metallo-hydrolase [Longimicrobiales bacterium]